VTRLGSSATPTASGSWRPCSRPLLRLEVEAVGGEILDKGGPWAAVTRERCAEVSRGENHPPGYRPGAPGLRAVRGEDRRGGLGSTWMLNSAAGVTLPGTATAPPITTIRAAWARRPRSRWSARATLVSGPRRRPRGALRSDQPSRESDRPVQHLKGMRGLWVARPTVRLAEATEVSKTVVTVEMGRGDQRPTSGPRRPGPREGGGGGRATSRTRKALAVPRSTSTLPATVVMASTEISGERGPAGWRGRRRCRDRCR